MLAVKKRTTQGERQMNTNLFAKTYLLGNEDASAFPNEGLYQLAEARGYEHGTDAFNWFVGGGAAFRFNGHTFETQSENIAA
jgi:glutamine synthetase type III